jgi:hypothetical protein
MQSLIDRNILLKINKKLEKISKETKKMTERPKLFYCSRVWIQSVKQVMCVAINTKNISFKNSTLLS